MIAPTPPEDIPFVFETESGPGVEAEMNIVVVGEAESFAEVPTTGVAAVALAWVLLESTDVEGEAVEGAADPNGVEPLGTGNALLVVIAVDALGVTPIPVSTSDVAAGARGARF